MKLKFTYFSALSANTKNIGNFPAEFLQVTQFPTAEKNGDST
jgi:hypothetical protein